jgi:hypothetical protein
MAKIPARWCARSHEFGSASFPQVFSHTYFSGIVLHRTAEKCRRTRGHASLHSGVDELWIRSWAFTKRLAKN